MKQTILFTSALLLCLSCALSIKAQDNIQLVDLGLSVLWADRNIGASTPESTGDYFAWGETETKLYYTWATYSYCDNGSPRAINKYCLTYDYGAVDSRNTLENKDDVALHTYGSLRMPTVENWKDLRNYCIWTSEISNGIIGYRVTGPNGNSIFLPAAGLVMADELKSYNEFGFYWSNTLYHTFNDEAVAFVFASNDAVLSHSTRELGIPVRAVQDFDLVIAK